MATSEAQPRLEFVQSGGFGGLTLTAQAGADEVDAAELQAVRDALAMAHERRTQGPRGPDRFQYELTLHDGDQARTLTLYEGAVPAALQGLITRLSQRATVQRE
jgi:hypothetical protein